VKTYAAVFVEPQRVEVREMHRIDLENVPLYTVMLLQG
jgi:hypothetical protein